MTNAERDMYWSETSGPCPAVCVGSYTLETCQGISVSCNIAVSHQKTEKELCFPSAVRACGEVLSTIYIGTGIGSS